MRLLLGIDYGTGGCKVTALRWDGSFAGEASVEEIIAHHVDLFGQPDKAATKPGHRPAVA